MKTCKYCGKELKIREGKKRLNPKRKYCNRICQTRYAAKKRYKRLGHTRRYKKIQKEKFNNWYSKDKNKIRQKKNCLLDYYRNKDKWRERHYVSFNRKKFLELLSKVCTNCGKEEVKILAHTRWDFPKRKPAPTRKEHKKYLKEYAKYLLPFCCRQCRIDYFNSHHFIEGRGVQISENNTTNSSRRDKESS